MIDHEQVVHNEALAFALKTMAALPVDDRNGFLMEFENGSPCRANFYDFNGIRLTIRNGGIRHFIFPVTFGPDTMPYECGERLRYYRETLIAWQSTVGNPLTFRFFNLLLAALSYDPESGTPQSD